MTITPISYLIGMLTFLGATAMWLLTLVILEKRKWARRMAE
jgi:hypothetical protein